MSEQNQNNIPINPINEAERIGLEEIPEEYRQVYFDSLNGKAKVNTDPNISYSSAQDDKESPKRSPLEELSHEKERRILSDLGRPFGNIALNPDVVQRPQDQPPQT